MRLTATTTAVCCALVLLFLAAPAVLAAGPPASFAWRGVGGGGALFSPSLSPYRPDELYLACDMSELFHSTDLGQSYATVDFRSLQSFHESRVQFTSDPGVLYVVDNASYQGVDLSRAMKSVDGGASWAPLPGDPTGGTEVYRLAADPASTTRLLLTDWGTLYFSDDGGQSFAPRYQALDSGSGCLLAGAFFDGSRIWAGTNDGLLYSGDGGQSFALQELGGIPAGESIVSLAAARQGSTVRFFAVTFAGGVWNGIQGWDHGGYAGVYTLDWGQPSWTLRTSGIDLGDDPFLVGMSPGNVSVAWLAGGGDASFPVVYRTTDAGQTWSNTFGCSGNSNIASGWSGSGGDHDWWYGEVALGLAVSPVDPDRAVFTDFGFAHVTGDGGQTWRQAYVAPADQHPAGAATPRRAAYHSIGLENTTAWSLAWASPGALFLGNSDISGSRSSDGGVTWGFDYSGHGENTMYRVIAHPASGLLYGATATVHDLYMSTTLTDSRIDGGHGRLLSSADQGATWQLVHDFGHVVAWVAADPTSASRLYAAVVHSVQGGIYVSSDVDRGAASTWTRLPTPPRSEGHPFNLVVLADGSLVASYSARRNSSGQFTASSGVFVSGDGGQTWADRSDPGMRYWTKDVVVDPSDPGQSTWYAGVFSGWGGPPNGLGGLYRTRDRGQSWTRVLDRPFVTSIAFDPANPAEAYVTTGGDGLLYTADAGAATPVFTTLPYPFRQPERVFFNPYDPAEMWVTSFGHGLAVARTGAVPATLLRDASISEVAPVPVPAIATVLPLDPAGDVYQTPVAPGDLDREAIAADPAHPLVFYGLDRTAVLKLVKSAATRVQVWF